MKPKKLSFQNIKNMLSRDEMKKIVAGSSGGGLYCGSGQTNGCCDVYCGTGTNVTCTGTCGTCGDAGNGAGPGQARINYVFNDSFHFTEGGDITTFYGLILCMIFIEKDLFYAYKMAFIFLQLPIIFFW